MKYCYFCGFDNRGGRGRQWKYYFLFFCFRRGLDQIGGAPRNPHSSKSNYPVHSNSDACHSFGLSLVYSKNLLSNSYSARSRYWKSPLSTNFLGIAEISINSLYSILVERDPSLVPPFILKIALKSNLIKTKRTSPSSQGSSSLAER